VRVTVQGGIEECLEMSVCDDGRGMPPAEVEQVFFAVGPRIHALPLLRQRLDRLFGRFFQLKVRTDIGQGTAGTIRIPLRGRFAIVEEAPDNATPAPKPKGL
jgi:sensor histidine kinase YesM